MRLMILVSLVVTLLGCATQPYRDTPESKFAGALDVRWVKNDYFLFLPNKEEPFTLLRANGEAIRPGPMYTDGGSIPRFLWGIEGYSPWGYAPAYIVHDWLFEARHCGYEPDNQHTFEDSVAVMAEALKSVMQANPEVRTSCSTRLSHPSAHRSPDVYGKRAPARRQPSTSTHFPGRCRPANC